MSLYAELLTMSLSSSAPDGSEKAGDLLAELLVRRSQRMAAEGSTGEGASRAIASELAYDTALLLLCRHLCLAVDLYLFRHPQIGRAHHESLLTSQGVRLDIASRPEHDPADHGTAGHVGAHQDTAGDQRAGGTARPRR